LESDVKSLTETIFRMITEFPSGHADLDCSTGKYSEFGVADSHLVLLAACTDIEPYMEGHRIHLIVGNPHAATFLGPKLTLLYGPDQLTAGLGQHKIDVSPATPLTPGSWTSVTAAINPSTPADLRALKLFVKFDQLRLTTGLTR